MSQSPDRVPEVILRLTFYDDDRVEVWSGGRRPIAEVVALLRRAADQWESGDARRIL